MPHQAPAAPHADKARVRIEPPPGALGALDHLADHLVGTGRSGRIRGQAPEGTPEALCAFWDKDSRPNGTARDFTKHRDDFMCAVGP